MKTSLIFKIKLVMLFFITRVHLTPVVFKEQNDARLEGKDPPCYFKIVGSQGSIYSPHISKENVTCEWKIDVMKGFVVVLEFEHLKLPVNREQKCETYVEISYGTQDDPMKRTICPADKVDRIHTDSQVAIIRYYSGTALRDNDAAQFGFKINYSAETSTTAKSQFGSNYAVMILLLSMATMCVIAVCLFCFRCNLYGTRGRRQTLTSDEPNVPTRQQLQETFEFQRSAMQADRKKMSQGSSFNTHLSRWASNPHLPSATTFTVPRIERRTASIMTTPRSVFPELRRKWSEDSVRRIHHLRTKLVARFSSSGSSNNTSSDISVFLPASDRPFTYSQLSSEEDRQQSKEDQTKEELQQPSRESRTVSCSSKAIPSIVIEFVE